MAHIPSRIDRGGGGFGGRPIRDLWISGLGIALGIIAGLWLPGPAWLKVAVALLLAGLGLAIGLGRHQGVWRFEELVLQFVSHKSRKRQMVWRRETPQDVPVAAAAAAAPQVPADQRQGFGQVRPLVDLWWGVVTAFVFAMMGGVTAYLATGGADDLILWWQFVTRGS
jgi:hypothetical protein